jgi:hypothetical protein
MITLCYIIFFKYLHLPAVSDLGPYSDLIVLWLLVRNRWCRLYSWPEHACQEPMLSTILKTRTILTGTGGVDYIHGQNMLVRNRWCWLYSWREHACQEPVVSTIFMTRTCLSGTGGVDYIHDQNMLVRNRWCRLFMTRKCLSGTDGIDIFYVKCHITRFNCDILSFRFVYPFPSDEGYIIQNPGMWHYIYPI